MSKTYTYILIAVATLAALYIAPSIMRGMREQYSNVFNPKTQVGRLTINDEIIDAADYTQTLHDFFENSAIKAVFIDINSPGGYSGSSQAIYQELVHLKKTYKKPVVIFSSDLCASGAYHIALAADYIVTCPAALVGSIGCYFSQFKFDKTIEWTKTRYENYKSGAYKNNLFTATTPEQARMMQELSNDTYQQFVHHVADARKLPIKTADIWANGRLFTGAQALKLKLIDATGSEYVAVEQLKKIANIKTEIEWVKPPQPSLLNKLLNESGRSQVPLKHTLETLVAHITQTHTSVRAYY